jgi:hypothetical protein
MHLNNPFRVLSSRKGNKACVIEKELIKSRLKERGDTSSSCRMLIAFRMLRL